MPMFVGALFLKNHDGMRHYFKVFNAWVLGWTCRKDEGVPNGYPNETISHLRVSFGPISRPILSDEKISKGRGR